MTATEPTPTAEHTDAVAVEFEHVVVGSGYYAMNIGTSAANESARAILTSSNPETHEALAANLPADVMLDALVDRGNDAELARRLEWATGLNGATLLVAIRSEGLEVVRVTPEQVAP